MGDRHEAEEVTLDVFHQVWRQAGRYDPERGRPMAWLLLIARSRSLDRLRSGARRRQHARPLGEDDEARHAAAPDASGRVEREELVRRALAGLSANQRAVLELAYLGGLSQSQVAERLELPLGTVKTRARRGLMQLRDAMTTPDGVSASERRLP